MRAKNQLACIEYMSQTNKEKEFYKKQFKSLNLLQKFEESIEKKQNTQEIFKFPIINQKNVIEYVILENSENGQQIYIDSETKYYVSYFQENTENKLTISIIKNQQLYLGEINLQEIEIKNENQKKIILEEIVIFQDNPNSSFLLDKQKFYQITLDINKMNQFIGTVIIYNFKQNQNKIYKFSDQNNNEIQGHIKGFTIIKHSDTSFSLLSGCMDGELYQQIGVKLDLVEQNSLKINQYQKQNNKLPKGYDYPLIVKFEPNNEQRNNSNKYLYFESQTKYQAQPFSPEIHQINFSHNQQNISCKSEILTNITNIQLFQKYSKLFRSDKINLKYQKCTSNIIVIDLVVFEKSFERNNLKDFNDNNKDIVLSKQPLQNYLHFQCCYYIKSFQTQLKFNLNINSILLKSNNDTLNQKCLYNNWLEDQNFQHIFLFNKSQHIYLLYYLKDKSGQYFKKKFTFYCDENPKDFIPYDEIMINDYYNNVIWIVRQYYDRNYPYLVIYNCHWMRLQGIKDDDVNILVKVKIDKIFELNINSQQFNLIGLEVRKTDNMLLICSSTFICQIPIQKIRNYNCNQQNIQKQMIDEKSLYQIFYTQLPICHNSQTILLNLNDTTIAFFYQYCTINCLDEKQTFYQIEIKAQIWSQKKQLDPNIENYLILSNSNDNMNYYNQNEIQDDKVLIKQSFNYEAKNTLILAKLISIEFKGQFFQYWIFFEQEFSQFQVIEYYFTSKCNSIIKKRIINLQQSQGTIQFLKSMSTNKYETLILYENSTQLIQSECNQDIFLNEETEQDLGQQKVHNYLDKQEYLLN
ncbi:unnamed protein product [Paramecium pentaurelia]|uniref:Uncharacterized protein n=1 Tax=Paramecium pentaurelia TaxID=43138 RepID=A0A8S1SK48_9CILI|nr:unnamed protein product [Paramecium pentaurelia]